MVGQVKLGGQDRSALALNLHMKMRRSTWVLAWYKRFKKKLALVVGVLVPAKPVAFIVVIAFVVALPEVKQGAGYGPAGGIHDLPDKLHARGFHVGFK